jgi:hypothetical protein
MMVGGSDIFDSCRFVNSGISAYGRSEDVLRVVVYRVYN